MPATCASAIVAVAGAAAASVACALALKRPKASSENPAPGKKMRRLVLAEPKQDLNEAEFRIEEVDIPKPKSGEVLVRMAAAPVNPSDYGSWKTGAPNKPIGNEGSGVVVASGGGIMARRLVGKTVGVTSGGKFGTYSEYVVVSALGGVFPLGDVPPADGASFFVNPYSVVGMLDTLVTDEKSRICVHTGASSKLGQMMVRLAPTMGVTIVNVVRRQEHSDMLMKLGAKYVICQADADWEKKLAELIKELKISIAFDCVAGDMTGKLVAMLPQAGKVYVYGRLSGQPCSGIEPVDLIYRCKQVRGFFLGQWVSQGGMLQTIRRIGRASKLVNPGLAPGGWAVSEFRDCTIDTMQAEFLKMLNGGGFTDAKLRIRMDG